MPQSLYNKYRPKRLQDIKGQFNTQVLSNSIRQNEIYPAYVLMGKHGTGKTTSARLFAQALNCAKLDSYINPCFECNACTKPQGYLTEINSAVNRGIDDVKEFIEAAKLRPRYGKYRVVIFDEFHQLSTDAISSLLKVVEEPPSHLVFIFCTTDNLTGDTKHAEALVTLISRCIILAFHPIDPDTIKNEVRVIARKENIFLKDDAITLITRNARGSLRDAIGLIDKFYLMQDLSLLISPEEDVALEMLGAISKHPADVIKRIKDVENRFIEPSLLWEFMIDLLRDIIFFRAGEMILHTDDMILRIEKLGRQDYDWMELQRGIMQLDVPSDYMKLQSNLLSLT